MSQIKTGRRNTDRFELARVPLRTGFAVSVLAASVLMSLLSLAMHVKLL